MQQITRLILLLLGGTTLHAQSSLMMAGGNSGANGGFQSPPASIRDLRMEFRIHSFTPIAPIDQNIVAGYNLYVAILGSQRVLRIVNWNTPQGSSETININGHSDLIIRVQEVVATATTSFEVWSIDGKLYNHKILPGRSSLLPGAAQLALGHNGGRGQNYSGGLAYFRLYDTVVPVGTVPANSTSGALLAYEFDSADLGPALAYRAVGTHAGRPLEVFGSITLAKTPLFTPVVRTAPSEVTVSTNTPFTLNAAGSLSGAPVAMWQWTQVSGPSTIPIPNVNSGTLNISGVSRPGSYVLQAKITDALGTSGTGQITIGAVDASPQGVVNVGNRDLAFALGPLLRGGLTPWPFYDQLRSEYGRRWGAAYPAGPPGEFDYRQGSIFLTNNSNLVAGSGTTFISDFMEPVQMRSGTVSVSLGGTVVQGTSTRFIDTFLSAQSDRTGTISLTSTSRIINGNNTSFASTTAPGHYLVTSVAGRRVSFRVSRVISDTSVEVERPWTDASATALSFRTARDLGLSLALRDDSGRTWLSEVSVLSDTRLFLRTSFGGRAATELPYGTTTLGPAAFLIVHYPVGDGTSGRLQYAVKAVTSDSSLILLDKHEGTNYRMTPFGRASQAEIDNWEGNLNYYDSVLVQYQNYYRTGHEEYRTYARKLADAWFLHFDSGRHRAASPGAPRSISLTGLILRAMDGRPEIWPTIRRAVSFNYDVWIGWRMNYPSLYYGVREGGYTLYHTALLGAVDPDLASRASYRRLALAAATNMYVRLQRPDGSWRWTDEGFWSGFGEQPFHVGLLLEGMIATHRITGDSTVLNSIIRSVDHLIAVQQPPPCRGPVYALYIDGGDWGKECPTPFSTPSYDAIRDTRAGNNAIMHAVGYVFQVTGHTRYRDAGDDMFAATFGNSQGPLADQYFGRADQSMKQYGQSFRTSDAYLAFRTGGVTDLYK